MNVLIVPTYEHLSLPYIEYIKERLKNVNYYLLQVEEPGANFSKINLDFFHKRESLTCEEFRESFSNSKDKILQFIRTNKIDKIVTFSDVTLFCRSIKGENEEMMTYVIQPCLLDFSKKSKFTNAKFFLKRIINFFRRDCFFNTYMYFGSCLNKANFLVWSKVENLELKRVNSNLNIIVVGRAVEEGFSNFNIFDKNSTNILIIAPDFNFYNKKQFKLYISNLTFLLKSLKGINFYIKLHPLNKAPFDYNFDNLFLVNSLEDINKTHYAYIISGYSNLALILARKHPNIIIHDSKKYNIPYINHDLFYIETDILVIFNFIKSNKTCNKVTTTTATTAAVNNSHQAIEDILNA
jgi:hypothetical protein